MYKVLLSKKSSKFIKNLQVQYRQKIIETLQKLAINPFSIPYKRIGGMEKVYRVRVGNYRIIYEIEQENMHIYVLTINSREKVYR